MFHVDSTCSARVFAGRNILNSLFCHDAAPIALVACRGHPRLCQAEQRVKPDILSVAHGQKTVKSQTQHSFSLLHVYIAHRI